MSGRKVDLVPCSLCGGTGEYKVIRLYYDDACRVVCRKCGAGTQPILIDHPVLRDGGFDESTRYNQAQALGISRLKWNNGKISVPNPII